MIHSLISQTRAKIQPGSYQLARRLAQESIEGMLRVGDNAEHLLAVHSHCESRSACETPVNEEQDEPFMEHMHEGRRHQRVL